MLRILGEVTVDGAPPVRSRPQRIVLAALGMRQGEAVGVDTLVDLIWASDLPDNPAASLQSHVSRLRRTLLPDLEIRSTGPGYALHGEVDALVFDRCLDKLTDLEPVIALGAKNAEFVRITDEKR